MAKRLKKSIVFLNGKVITADENFKIAQAVLVKDGRFFAVGSNEEIRASAGLGAEMIDLRGKTVLPGFVDSHNHILLTEGGSQKGT